MGSDSSSCRSSLSAASVVDLEVVQLSLLIKPTTPSELVALGKALEEMERPRARERMESGVRPCAHVSTGSIGKTRNIVGSAIGMSGATYQRAKLVVEAAEDDGAEPSVRQVALRAQAEMDKTGTVFGPYNKVRRAQREAEQVPESRLANTSDNLDLEEREQVRAGTASLRR